MPGCYPSHLSFISMRVDACLMDRLLCVPLFTLLFVSPVTGQDSAPNHCDPPPPPDDQVTSVLGVHPDMRGRHDGLRTMPSSLGPLPFEVILHAAATRRSDFLPDPIPNKMAIPTPDSPCEAVWLYRFAVDRAHEMRPGTRPVAGLAEGNVQSQNLPRTRFVHARFQACHFLFGSRTA